MRLPRFLPDCLVARFSEPSAWSNLLILAGLHVVSIGAALIYLPAGFICYGCAMVLLARLIASASEPPDA